MKQKKYRDIENLRKEGDYTKSNAGGFKKGTHIIVQEKVDGSNASVTYDESMGEIRAYSRRKPLTYDNTLNGFYNYVALLPQEFKNFLHDNPQFVVFGEWNLGGNKIKDYDEYYMHDKWIVYDVYDSKLEDYLPFVEVKNICERFRLELIHVLYDGQFISWEALQPFMHQNTYGGTQEGIVVKRQGDYFNEDDRYPSYLKIVNKQFAERMNKVKAPLTEEEKAIRAKCQEVVDEVVTFRRVEKGIEKLRDDGVFPYELTPEDMKTVARYLPKYIYQDCLKEEEELVRSAGEKFGKMCGSKTMAIAREIILG